MRRSDREVTDPRELEDILQACPVVRIGARDGQGPFVVPMNYGYAITGGELTLYLHSAQEGRKVAAFRTGEPVAFEMDCSHALLPADSACAYSYSYRSIMGSGTLRELLDPEEKRSALCAIMVHLTGQDTWEFPSQALDRVAVFVLRAAEWTGKSNPIRGLKGDYSDACL